MRSTSIALRLLAGSGIPFLLSGTYALPASPASPGRPRISTSSASRATPRDPRFFKDRGYEIEIEDERWIGKVWRGELSSTSSSTSRLGSIPITDEWFQESL